MPVLIGYSLGQAKALLESNGLSIGSIVPDPDVTDTLNAYIYWQNPPRYDQDRKLMHIRSGQLMDVRLSVQRPIPDSTKVQEPVQQ